MMQYKHGGDIYSYAEQFPGKAVLDFSSNINPLGTPEPVQCAIRDAAAQCSHYPDPFCRQLTKALANKYRLAPEMIFCANGAADVFFRLADVLRPKKALLTAPTFSEYAAALSRQGCMVQYHALYPAEGFAVTERILDALKDIDICFLCSPNNPTGCIIEPRLLHQIVRRCERENIWLAVDECFMDFVVNGEQYTLLPYLQHFKRLIVVRAFTKIYAMPGVRLGWCASAAEGLSAQLYAVGQPWAVSVIAQACGQAALSMDGFEAYTANYIVPLRRQLVEELRNCGMSVFESQANYLLFYTDYHDLREKLLPHGIMLRDCSDYQGLSSGYFRIAVKNKEDNDYLIRKIQEAIWQKQL